MNDNQNYFVTRSTSRVLSVPGGKCSIDIFGDADSNSINNNNRGSNKSNQSSAVTTAPSTSRYGTNAASNPSTQPVPDAAQIKNEAARNKHRAMDESYDLFGLAPAAAPKPAKAAVADNEEEEATAAGVSSAKTTSVSSNQFASANTTNSYNVITDRPTSRVLQPPGGKSSDFIFG
ncbi:hypothetical protein HJC23_010636 [Cyclotella cryptica]|uniref:Microtubule-associated protein Jupiter n=1 Tax=Cyclotella cryptica TaxID=29204 RepID=A0ABD3PHB3_9STRA|eukprot:CCRYP_014838-RA/>CCRYP_014838-RA protein AED:0.14 eAED:0.14 QI:332/1/1/1/0/0/2/281/175